VQLKIILKKDLKKKTSERLTGIFDKKLFYKFYNQQIATLPKKLIDSTLAASGLSYMVNYEQKFIIHDQQPGEPIYLTLVCKDLCLADSQDFGINTSAIEREKLSGRISIEIEITKEGARLIELKSDTPLLKALLLGNCDSRLMPVEFLLKTAIKKDQILIKNQGVLHSKAFVKLLNSFEVINLLQNQTSIISMALVIFPTLAEKDTNNYQEIIANFNQTETIAKITTFNNLVSAVSFYNEALSKLEIKPPSKRDRVSFGLSKSSALKVSTYRQLNDLKKQLDKSNKMTAENPIYQAILSKELTYEKTKANPALIELYEYQKTKTIIANRIETYKAVLDKKRC